MVIEGGALEVSALNLPGSDPLQAKHNSRPINVNAALGECLLERRDHWKGFFQRLEADKDEEVEPIIVVPLWSLASHLLAGE